MVIAPRVHIARQNAIRKITGRITRNFSPAPRTTFPSMVSSRRTTICAYPNPPTLSLLRCFLSSLLLSSPAGWRGARRRVVSCPLQNDSNAAGLVFLLMTAPPATRSGPPAGVLAGVPRRRPCSYRLLEIRVTGACSLCVASRQSPPAQDLRSHLHWNPRPSRPGTRSASHPTQRNSCRRSAPS